MTVCRGTGHMPYMIDFPSMVWRANNGVRLRRYGLGLCPVCQSYRRLTLTNVLQRHEYYNPYRLVKKDDQSGR